MQPFSASRHELRDVPLVDHLLIAVGHPVLEELEVRVAHPGEGRTEATVGVLLVDVVDLEAPLVAEDLEVPAQVRGGDADVVDAECACSLLRLAGILEIESGDEASEADELSRDEAELDDFLIREMGTQLGEEAVVELVMVLGHEGGEAEGHRLPRGEVAPLEVGERRHHVLRHALPHRRRGPRLLSGGAVVEGGDLEPDQLLELRVEHTFQAQGRVKIPVRFEGVGEMAHGLEDGRVLTMPYRLLGEIAEHRIETLGGNQLHAGHERLLLRSTRSRPASGAGASRAGP